VLVTWETASEREMIGFDVLRRRADGGPEQPVTPVWIPAVGRSGDPTSYRFLDPTADPAVAYVYRVRGITTTGLTAATADVTVPAQHTP